MISAVACATVSIAPPERGELLREEVRSEHTTEDANLMKQAIDEVSRYRSMDRLIPSPKNVVTTAVLEVSSFLHQSVSLVKDFNLTSVLLDSYYREPHPERSPGLLPSYPVCYNGRIFYFI